MKEEGADEMKLLTNFKKWPAGKLLRQEIGPQLPSPILRPSIGNVV